jgi:hypothetical protein
MHALFCILWVQEGLFGDNRVVRFLCVTLIDALFIFGGYKTVKKILSICLATIFCIMCVGCNDTGGNNSNDLLIAPSESYVIESLNKVPGIIEIDAATEDNDPNGQLNKAGGYISNVYFSYVFVNQSEVIGDSLIDKGTDAGGSIEVYSTVKDAEKRNEYLAYFDGGVLS